MCYICKLRLAKLLEKGYIFDAQIAEVTSEIKVEFDKAFNSIAEKLDDMTMGAVLETLRQGTVPNAQDYLKTTIGNKIDQGMTDELLEKILQNYDPRKAN